MSRMLLSIKPEYAQKIVVGTKKYEFRKFHCRRDVDTIVIYVTTPVKRVIGEASLIRILEGDLALVWRETKGFGGIRKKDYLAYFGKRDTAIAYQLGCVTLYDEPMLLEELGLHYVPQSFAYIL